MEFNFKQIEKTKVLELFKEAAERIKKLSLSTYNLYEKEI
ncbi:hypothetical protein FVB9532_01678 [Mesonia oceanica]|uniref:Uncharacterized protein n=1 Tax=Mesonia oceanica TaxID=2687242 RepID=A0AC61Y7L9_9FLAO|nr:hypothetical protein FVB9532_01678 [Mesonia oceanica]|tara:strand:- start:274 stop:393 length:120 start_codon:yes stop_codon:yes gene_type:complete